jgi:hypothetical protein
MVEYGNVVGQSSGAGGGGAGGGGWFDLGSDPVAWFENIVDRIASLPPEVLVFLVAAVVIFGLVRTRRTS